MSHPSVSPAVHLPGFHGTNRELLFGTKQESFLVLLSPSFHIITSHHLAFHMVTQHGSHFPMLGLELPTFWLRDIHLPIEPNTQRCFSTYFAGPVSTYIRVRIRVKRGQQDIVKEHLSSQGVTVQGYQHVWSRVTWTCN